MTPEELEKVEEEVADTLYDLVKLGLVETHDIDENGNFTYRLTEKGKEAGEELRRLGLGEI